LFGAQSAAVTQLPVQVAVVVAQMYGAHDSVLGGLQLPVPSHVRAGVSAPAAHDAAPQLVPEA
jgi:hypothetical protein